MAEEAVEAISSFQRDDMSPRARRARQLADAVPQPRRQQAGKATGADKGSFRQFLAARQPARQTPAAPQVPTEQRLVKEDKPRKTQAGFYRAPAPIERLRDRGSLDHMPHINEAMYQAANKLGAHFYEAGLGGIAAQDLSRDVRGSGDGGACGFPKTERAMHHRQKFREACNIMGWFETHPYKGAGRLVVDVVCFEMSLTDASKVHLTPGGSNEARLGAGMERLRTGLFGEAQILNLFQDCRLLDRDRLLAPREQRHLRTVHLERAGHGSGGLRVRDPGAQAAAEPAHQDARRSPA